MALDAILADVTHAARLVLDAQRLLEEATNQRMIQEKLDFLACLVDERDDNLREAQTQARLAGATEKAVAIATLNATRGR